jgi:mannose-6-phosphate isomerase-like protein (cupin superfamily)
MLKIYKKTSDDENKLLEINKNCQADLGDIDFSKVIVKKPWGYEYLVYEGEDIAAWCLHIKKDYATSMHCHADKETVLIVLSGKVICSGLNESSELSEGDCAIIEKRKFHSTKAVSSNAIILEIENPANKTDLIRLKDSYGRALKGYESKNEMCSDLSVNERVFLNLENLNLNKRIGAMEISIKTFNNNFSLIENLNRYRNSVNFILSGEVDDEKNGITCKKGNILFDINNGGKEGIKIKKPLKILSITKDTSDFD